MSIGKGIASAAAFLLAGWVYSIHGHDNSYEGIILIAAVLGALA